MSASSTTIGTALGTSMFEGKYAVAKGLADNALDQGLANAHDDSTASSAIALGTLTVKDTQAQQQKTGQSAMAAGMSDGIKS